MKMDVDMEQVKLDIDSEKKSQDYSEKNEKDKKSSTMDHRAEASGVDYDDDDGPMSQAKKRKLTEMKKEVDKLKEFLVLDEADHDTDKEEESESDSDYDVLSDDVPEEEIEAMLDEGLPSDHKGHSKKIATCPYDQRKKIVLEEKGVNHFEVLPLGWLVVPHHSGMPLYLHKPSRVCTLAKPYFLGPGSARKHEIPISAIPCYNYRRALEEENASAETNGVDDSTTHIRSAIDLLVNKKSNIIQDISFRDFKVPLNPHDKDVNITNGPSLSKTKNDDHTSDSDKDGSQNNQKLNEKAENTGNTNGVDIIEVAPRRIANHDLLRKLINTDPIANGETSLPMMPNAKVETAQENWRKFHLKHNEVTDYCKRLFKFKSISIMRFKSWSERRKFTKSRKALQRPTLPDGTKLITFPIHTTTNAGSDGSSGSLGSGVKTARKECLMNPSGKSYVCILHEYVQRALKKQPTYEFKELENGATPYSATISINDMRYGIGYGTSKRQAKSAAAKAAIEILIPEMREKILQDSELNGTASRSTDRDLAFFDDILIEDPRVSDFCSKTMEPSPNNVLQTCLARNFGIGDREIKYETNTLKHQQNQFTMTVGKHTATVICKNKRDGKQRASQAILQALHPNITSWGSLLRLYGTRSVKSFKEKKLEEQEITLLQSRAAINQPNYAILEKLKSEMTKLQGKDMEVNPIGTLVVQEDLPTHSGSNLNNVDL